MSRHWKWFGIVMATGCALLAFEMSEALGRGGRGGGGGGGRGGGGGARMGGGGGMSRPSGGGSFRLRRQLAGSPHRQPFDDSSARFHVVDLHRSGAGG